MVLSAVADSFWVLLAGQTLLGLGVPLFTLMLASLGLPTLVAAAMHRAVGPIWARV